MQEFRRMGIPVIPFVPSKGKDKHTRVNATAPLFESGSIWYPEGERFADEVIEECAAFPNGEYDDYVDSTTQGDFGHVVRSSVGCLGSEIFGSCA